MKAAILCAALAAAGCAHTAGPPAAEASYAATDGRTYRQTELVAGDAPAVVVFFCAMCPTQRAHDPRLLELHARFAPRGVRFFLVDSNADGTLAQDTEEAKKRGYPFPVLMDPDGSLRELFQARFSTHSVVLDAKGTVRYRGGIDSDIARLSEGATPYLARGIEAALEGKDPEVREAKALGCALRRK